MLNSIKLPPVIESSIYQQDTGFVEVASNDVTTFAILRYRYSADPFSDNQEPTLGWHVESMANGLENYDCSTLPPRILNEMKALAVLTCQNN
jgi:hypothetical protein